MCEMHMSETHINTKYTAKQIVTFITSYSNVMDPRHIVCSNTTQPTVFNSINPVSYHNILPKLVSEEMQVNRAVRLQINQRYDGTNHFTNCTRLLFTAITVTTAYRRSLSSICDLHTSDMKFISLQEWNANG
jgi:hypothetical protein